VVLCSSKAIAVVLSPLLLLYLGCLVRGLLLAARGPAKSKAFGVVCYGPSSSPPKLRCCLLSR
jgi:hypothetical protein